MDERKSQEQIEEWMNQLLPDPADPAVDVGMWQQPECSSVKAEIPNSFQLSVNSCAYPRNLSQDHQLMQTSSGCNSASLMANCENGSLNVMQHTDQTPLQRILETKGGVGLERAHSRLQMPALHQSQNITFADQLKPANQAQEMLFGNLQASSESTSRVDLTNSIDWVNSTYQKILQMKEMYLPQFFTLHHKMQEMRRHSRQVTNAEMVNKLQRNIAFIEKIIRLLNISKTELLQVKMERVCQLLNDAVKFISQIRTRNSVSENHVGAPHSHPSENHLQFNSASLHQASRPGGSLGLPQSTLNSFNVGSSAVHKVGASSTVNSYQYNLMRPTQQWAPQRNINPSPQKGSSQMGFDPRALRMLLHPSSGASQYNNMGTLQQTVASSRNIFNSLDYSTDPIPQMHVSMPPLQNNQQDQTMKRQKMKQPVQQLLADKNKQQMLHKRTEDMKLQRFIGINQKRSPVLPPSSSPYAVSPQNSQQSSPQLELKDVSLKFPKSATPSLTSTSPSSLPSPLTPLTIGTPLTPSSIPEDSIKSPLLEEHIKLAQNPTAAYQSLLQDTIHNHISTDTHRSNKSCFHRESTFGNERSSQDKGNPMKRLVEAVKSASSKSLSATLRDINAVTSLTDRTARSVLHVRPTKVFFHDLADDIISNCNEGTFSLENSTEIDLRTKRDFVSVALDDFTTTDSEFGASGSRINKLKTEPNNLLLEEIKEINQKLIEIVVDVMTLEDVSRLGSDRSTHIRCSYIPVGLSGNIKFPNTLKYMFPNLLLELIVSADYPNSSPTVLEKVPSCFCDADEGKYLWMKAMSNFILSLRKFSVPISVKDMAEAWDVSAREVFHELAEKMGGGSFSTSYGKWENCTVAV